MKLKPFIVLTLIVVTFGTCSSLLADATVTQVTNNSYQDSFPRIKGDYLVWQGYVEDDWEIFLYNTATKETTQITDNTYDDLSPQTDGNYIVWQGFQDGEWDIFIWAGGEPQAISDRSAEDVSPQIANGFVVWNSEPFGGDFVGASEIILYRAGTQSRTVLSEDVDPGNTMDDTAPEINDEVVIWTQTDDQGNATLYMYDLSSTTITPDPDYVWKDTPRVDGNLRVLTQHDGHDRELFLYNSDSRRSHQVTHNGLQDRYPSISGNYVAWMAGGEIFLAKVLYLGLVRPVDGEVLPSSPAPTFKWEAIGYDACNVECSKDLNFVAETTLTLPVEGDKALSDITYTPTSPEWQLITAMERESGYVYWRVKGKDEGANSAYSETWSFTVRVDGDNGGGAGAWCFIDTAAHRLGWWETIF